MDANTAFKILELPRDASLEEIKQARRELIFIWHPDKHQANQNAQKRALQKTKDINEAYELLCNYLNTRSNSSQDEFILIQCSNCGASNRVQGNFREGLRCGKCGSIIRNNSKNQRIPCGDGTCIGVIRENGRCGICGKTWEEAERDQRDREQSNTKSYQENTQSNKIFESIIEKGTEKLLTIIYKKYKQSPGTFKFGFWALIIFSLILMFSEVNTKKSSLEKPSSPPPVSKPNVVINPVPNIKTGYIKDFVQKRKSGHSKITVDNSKNDNAVLAKLFYLGGEKPRAVRAFSIRAGDIFTCKNISPGIYDLRYKVLSSNQKYKTPEMSLEQYNLEDRIQYSTYELTLYKVPHGNMHTYPISEDDFESE